MAIIKINPMRLNQRLDELAKIGATSSGAVSRLALSDEDKTARDLVARWMKDLKLETQIDQAGNIIGVRQGKTDIEPVVIGSHIDTVLDGGRFDGAAGVMSGLEIVETLNIHNIQTERPIALVVFTNEEGARYHPDMLGSRLFCGLMTPQEAYSIQSTDGTQFGEELKRINYAGEFPCGVIHPLAYLELHIEQGPILDRTGITIGVVEAITGISWYKITIRGEANHVGTTPTSMRHDAGLAAAKIITQLREIANSLGENQRATCGSISFYPNTINVIPATVVMTVDMRNPDLLKLNEAEKQLENFLEICQQEDGVGISSYSLARVTPKDCDPEIIGLITKSAQELGYSQRPMISGAIHDALIMASYCPTGMIFIPSKKGISHNALEYTNPEDLEAGANVLLQSTLKLASKNKYYS